MRVPHVHFRQALNDETIMWSLGAEAFGTLLFQLLGAASTDNPFVNGVLYAAIAYMIKHVSGGHVNPAVSLAAAGSGHIDWTRGLLYSLAQVVGAIVGALLQVGLVPGSKLGHAGPGCFRPSHLIHSTKLFGWEFILTTFFLLVVYAAIFTKPTHGDVGPLASGLALAGALAAAGYFTGGSPLNPARTIAGSLVFRCAWDYMWVYLLAQLIASVVASFAAVALYGKGPHYRAEGPTAVLRETLMGEESEGPGEAVRV